MNSPLVLDLVVLTTIAGAAFRGWTRKSVREALALLGFVAALVLVVGLTGLVSTIFELFSAGEDLARAMAAGLLFVIGLVAGVIAGIRAARNTSISGPRWLDSLGGVAFALVRTMALAALVLLCLDIAWGQSSVGHRMIADSLSGRFLVDDESPFAATYTSLIHNSTDLRALERWAQQDERSSEVGYLQNDFEATGERLIASPTAEREMLRAINSSRRERGLPPLEWCGACAEVARSHSKDMYRDGYFSHEDLDGDDPFDRMIAAGISYGAAGENLALAPTVEEAHTGLMASPDHRANILRRAFDEVGIGIYRGPYGLMCTQVFRALP